MNIYLKAYNILGVLYVYGPLIYKFLECLVNEKNKYEYFACFYENPY